MDGQEHLIRVAHPFVSIHWITMYQRTRAFLAALRHRGTFLTLLQSMTLSPRGQ